MSSRRGWRQAGSRGRSMRTGEVLSGFSMHS